MFRCHLAGTSATVKDRDAEVFFFFSLSRVPVSSAAAQSHRIRAEPNHDEWFVISAEPGSTRNQICRGALMHRCY